LPYFSSSRSASAISISFRDSPGCARPGEPHDLHAERASAADDAAAIEVEAGGARERERIDAGMSFEALVFEGDEREAVLFGRPLDRRKAPLAVVGDARAEQRAVARDDDGRQRLVEQGIGQPAPETDRDREQGERAQRPPDKPWRFHRAETTSTHCPRVRAALVASYIASTERLGR
jgi:hypothetical protein